MNKFYVYVYIDPRNLEEFYFGKGQGSRKNAHLSDTSDSEICGLTRDWYVGIPYSNRARIKGGVGLQSMWLLAQNNRRTLAKSPLVFLRP